MNTECLFNKVSGVRDEDLPATISLNGVGDCEKKCKRCGGKLGFRVWQGKGRKIGYMETSNRPAGCNGETHP